MKLLFSEVTVRGVYKAKSFSILPLDTKASHIAREILSYIASGRYQPGDKLPSERELSQLFGVSRTVVREALIALRLVGIVERYAGDGSYVKALRPASVKRMQERLNKLFERSRDPLEAWQARVATEPGIARLAAREARSEDFKRLNKAIARMQVAIRCKLTPDFYKADRDFHLAVVFATHNDYLLQIMRPLLDCIIHPIWWEIKAEAIDGNAEPFHVSLALHAQIAQAIQQRDEEAAYKHMELHFSVLARYLDGREENFKEVSQ